MVHNQPPGSAKIEPDAIGRLRHTQQHIAAMQQQADAVFNNFLDLVGRPERRYTLPSREWA